MEVPFQSVPREPAVRRPSLGLVALVLLAVSLLFGVSTLQALHAHDAGVRRDGLAQVSAPADECPLCAAPYAAVAAPTRTTVTAVPEAQRVGIPAESEERAARWSFTLFSRPPPARLFES